ncbi:MAG: hypothetical protein R3C19_04885 [Planctomycetaceae bacterium]
MAECKYRIQTVQGLSKQYTLEQLRLRKADGLIDDASKCTPDDGDSWTPLGMLLMMHGDSRELHPSPGRRQRSAPTTHKTASSESEERGASATLDVTPRFLRSRRATAVILSLGLAAVFALGWMSSGYFRSPNPELFGGKSTEVGKALSPEEMTSKIDAMENRLRFVQSTLPAIEKINRKLDFEARENSTVPLIGYQPREVTADEKVLVDERLMRYSRLVREKGANGSRLDDSTVRTYSRYLVELIELIDSERTGRDDALMKLAELVKFIYLLQLGNLRSGSQPAHQEAEQLILESSNIGLRRLFVELQTGDVGFYDVVASATPRERAGMLLVRYWFYRAHNPADVDQWLQKMLADIDPAYHGEIYKSINEVAAIE